MTIASIQYTSDAASQGLRESMTCPDRRGLIGEYLLRGNAATMLRNRANPALPATLTGAGSPVYNTNSVVLSGHSTLGGGVAGIDTGLAPPRYLTYIVVRKKRTAGNNNAIPWLGSVVGGANLGLADYDGWNMANAQAGIPPVTAKIVAPTDSDFHFQAGVAGDGGKPTVYVSNGGVLTSNTGTGNGPYKAAGPTIKIVPEAYWQFEIAYVGVYARMLTAGQVAAADARIRAYLLGRGVVVS
jgi:hypothetical protein